MSPKAPARAAGARTRPAHPAQAPAPEFAPALLAAAALLVVVLLAAPPDSNYAWGVNGWRSVGGSVRVALLAAAAAATLPALLRARGAIVFAAVATALALTSAFALRESLHFLGDTQLRVRSLTSALEGVLTSPFAEWSARLHAAPLDAAVNVFGTLTLARAGLGLPAAVSWTGIALAAAWFAGAWRVATRLGAGPDERVPMALALGTSGALLAFAGYAESAGLLAAATMVWWAELLAPLDRRSAAWRLAAAWTVVLLSHRVGLLLLLPMAWRAFGPALPGDQPPGRRALAPAAAAALAVALLASVALSAGAQVGADLRDLWAAVRALAFLRQPVTDVANGLVLLAPLALLAPFAAGRRALAAFVRSPLAWLVAVTAVPLFVVVGLLLPLSGNGLGAHRDWDAGLPLGIALSVAACALIASLPAARRRATWIVALPLCALLAGGWMAVQADSAAVERRAQALASRPPLLADLQRSHVHLFLGQRAMDQGRFADGARAYEQSFALAPNPRRALLAAEAWVLARQPVAARRMIAAARARGPLPPELESGAARLEAALAAEPTPAPGAR